MNEQGYNMVGRKLFIGLPAYDFKISLKMAISLMALSRKAMEHGVDIQVGSICGCSVVSRARNLIVEDFLESECTDLLFIDADINFNPEDVFRLLAWVTRPLIGIAAGVPSVRRAEKTYIVDLDEDKNSKSLTFNNMGLVRAKRVATAFMMIRKEVFLALKDVHPEWKYYDTRAKNDIYSYFDFKSTPEGYIGEDFLFCDRAREQGYEVWIDPTIKLGHMGVTEFQGDFGNDILYPLVGKVA